MPSAREQALNAIKAGDVVLGISASGNGSLLLVYEVTENDILARHVPSGARAEFGRDGNSRWCEGGGSCTIVSTAALPPDLHAVVIGLDRKMQTAKEHPDFVLSKAEIDLLLTHEEFFKSRLLPD